MRAQRRSSSSLKLSPTGAVAKTIAKLCMAAVQVQDNYNIVNKKRLGVPQPLLPQSYA
jgi:hypothetical protein